jgi:hypothetical protein
MSDDKYVFIVLLVALAFFAIVNQPTHADGCYQAEIVELESSLNDNAYLAAVISDHGTETARIDKDIFYKLEVGERVEICYMVGSWIPINSANKKITRIEK